MVDIPDPTLPSGWTRRAHVFRGGTCLTYATKIAGASEPGTVTCTHVEKGDGWLVIAETDGVYGGSATGGADAASTQTIPAVTPDAGAETLLLAAMSARLAYDVSSGPSGYSTLEESWWSGELRELTWYRYIASASGSYSSSCSFVHWVGAAVIHAFVAATPPAPTADFSADVVGGPSPLTVQFTDLSVGAPTSWAWTFGDGGTSSSQNPSHVYAAAGTYTVSLTATNAIGSDTETKTAYITVSAGDDVYEPPPPAAAILEIYAAAPGAARWDVALWDQDLWSAASWQDVTPEGIKVQVRWGSTQPERGVLSLPAAATWAVSTYDPHRILDPSNADGPYFGDLVPGLPIRLSHRGIVVRRGMAEAIGYSFANNGRGYIRATDVISPLANAAVPSDTTLSDTLYARARDAISAAGLAVEVLPDPPAGDPALFAWATGTDRTAWEWITDAAQSVLHVPVIDARGRLGFRAWASPLARGRGLASPELIDLQAISSFSGLYSIVRVRDDSGAGGTILERALTPTPAYGKRTVTRDEQTPNADAWAAAVLADRSYPSLRWVPGDVRPLTALSVEQLATIEAVELVSLTVLEAEPDVAASAIVVGGEIVAIGGKSAAEAIWRFRFEAAQTPIAPLIVSNSSPPEYLLDSDGTAYMYESR